MNLPSYSTKLNKKLQQLSQTWEQEILSHLPENLDTMAQNSGIIKRKRGISSAIQLLKILFLYAASDVSFRLLAAVTYGLGISDISDTAWRKKYRKATPFLQDVLQQLLSFLFPPSGITPKNKQVLLVDASLIRQQGKQQYQQCIHTCYSLNQNRIQQIQITDYHTAESFRMFSFQKEDLILEDEGYGKAGNYAYAMEQGCDVILRISPNHISLLTVEEEKLDIYTYYLLKSETIIIYIFDTQLLIKDGNDVFVLVLASLAYPMQLLQVFDEPKYSFRFHVTVNDLKVALNIVSVNSVNPNTAAMVLEVGERGVTIFSKETGNKAMLKAEQIEGKEKITLCIKQIKEIITKGTTEVTSIVISGNGETSPLHIKGGSCSAFTLPIVQHSEVEE